MTQFTLSEHITLNIGCSMNLDTPQKFKMIYFDPPFNSDREYKLNCNSDVGFSDKWEDCDYETFIRKNSNFNYLSSRLHPQPFILDLH